MLTNVQTNLIGRLSSMTPRQPAARLAARCGVEWAWRSGSTLRGRAHRCCASSALHTASRRWRTNRQHENVVPARLEVFTRRMWEEAAAAVGASFSEPAPRLFEFYREGLTVHVLGQRTPFADPVSIELASAKDLSYTLLTRAGVRVPEHVVVRREDRRPRARSSRPARHPLSSNPRAAAAPVLALRRR